MNTLVLGVPLPETRINIKRSSRQGFAIEWFLDIEKTQPASFAGVTMKISLGDRDAPTHVWDATISANRTTWTLTEAQTDLPFKKYGGVMTMTETAGETLLFRVVADVED